MRKIGARLIALLCAAVALGACSRELRWEDGRTDLLWAERQVVFALSPARGRVDVYSIRGGVSWLGGAVLPVEECFHALALDPAAGRLWLWSDRGGVLLDARRLRALARWEGRADVAPAPPTSVVVARVAPGQAVCPSGRVAVADAGRP